MSDTTQKPEIIDAQPPKEAVKETMAKKSKVNNLIDTAKKHKVISCIVIVLLLCFGCTAFGAILPKTDNTPAATTKSVTATSTVQITTTDTPIPTSTTIPTLSMTVNQKNALAAAKSYLNYTAFSHDGLVVQLEYEKYAHADAVYGADNCGADWNEQAAKAAKSYMAYSAFSRGGLIDQLKYEKFTQAQAEYGADSVGLK
jgi:hypothetical protein